MIVVKCSLSSREDSMNSIRRSLRRNDHHGSVMLLFVVAAITVFIVVGASLSNSPWRTEVCTVTGKYTNALQASKGQTFDFVETTCGDYGFNRWMRGSDGFDKLEVGKTYEFGINGVSYLWSKPSVVTWKELN